jgi:hypothetical protein
MRHVMQEKLMDTYLGYARGLSSVVGFVLDLVSMDQTQLAMHAVDMADETFFEVSLSVLPDVEQELGMLLDGLTPDVLLQLVANCRDVSKWLMQQAISGQCPEDVVPCGDGGEILLRSTAAQFEILHMVLSDFKRPLPPSTSAVIASPAPYLSLHAAVCRTKSSLVAWYNETGVFLELDDFLQFTQFIEGSDDRSDWPAILASATMSQMAGAMQDLVDIAVVVTSGGGAAEILEVAQPAVRRLGGMLLSQSVTLTAKLSTGLQRFHDDVLLRLPDPNSLLPSIDSVLAYESKLDEMQQYIDNGIGWFADRMESGAGMLANVFDRMEDELAAPLATVD